MIESQFPEIAENQPELLARHSTEAGLIEQSAHLWGKAGQRSLARSALIEAEAQLARALVQIASLPGTAALRREAIKLQVALLNALAQATLASIPIHQTLSLPESRLAPSNRAFSPPTTVFDAHDRAFAFFRGAPLRTQLRDEIARMTSLSPNEIEVHATNAVIRVVLVNKV